MIPLKKQYEADVAVIGGGIAGLMAAIAAADKGAQVVLLDKANTKRSGAGAHALGPRRPACCPLCGSPEKIARLFMPSLRFSDTSAASGSPFTESRFFSIGQF